MEEDLDKDGAEEKEESQNDNNSQQENNNEDNNEDNNDDAQQQVNDGRVDDIDIDDMCDAIVGENTRCTYHNVNLHFLIGALKRNLIGLQSMGRSI